MFFTVIRNALVFTVNDNHQGLLFGRIRGLFLGLFLAAFKFSFRFALRNNRFRINDGHVNGRCLRLRGVNRGGNGGGSLRDRGDHAVLINRGHSRVSGFPLRLIVLVGIQHQGLAQQHVRALGRNDFQRFLISFRAPDDHAAGIGLSQRRHHLCQHQDHRQNCRDLLHHALHASFPPHLFGISSVRRLFPGIIHPRSQSGASCTGSCPGWQQTDESDRLRRPHPSIRRRGPPATDTGPPRRQSQSAGWTA